MEFYPTDFMRDASRDRKYAILLASVFIVVLPLVIIGNASAASVQTVNVQHATHPQTLLTVTTYFQNGTQIQGMYIELQDSQGNDISTGYSPVTFVLTPGEQYEIYANSWGNIQFSTWSYPPSTADPLSFSEVSGVQGQLSALYSSVSVSSSLPLSSSQSTHTHSSSTSSSSGDSVLTVLSQNSLGNSITGYFTELYSGSGDSLGTGYTPSVYTLTNGVQYQVEADSYGACSFSYWSGGGVTGSTSDPVSISISGATTLNAVYTGSSCGPQTSTSSSTTTTTTSSSTTTTTTTSSTTSSKTSTTSSTSSSTSSTTTTSSTTSHTSSTTTSSSSGGGRLGLIVPMYMYPDSDWNTLMSAKESYPSVPVVAIINPSNGPGSSRDSTYASYTANMAAAGVTIAGYIDTMEMSASISSVEAQMRDYQSWYPQTSIIFLDDMPDSYSSAFGSYFSTLTTYAHSIGMTTMGNPGWEVSASSVGTTDGIMFYETDGLPTLSYLQGADVGYPASHFSFVATSVSSLPTQSYLNSVYQYAAYVYITNQAASYDNLPSYLTQEMSMLAAT